MRRATIAACALLAACEVAPPLEARLQPLIGQSETALVQAMGVPTGSYESGGLKFLQYEERQTTAYPGDPFWPGWRRFGPGFASPPLVVTRSCAVTFTLRGGVVESFAARGNACR